MTKQAKHMRNNNGRYNGSASKKARIVAIALAGALALGGIGAGTLALMHNSQSPGQSVATSTTTTAQQKKAEPAKQVTTKQSEQAAPAQTQAQPAKQTQQAAPAQPQAQPATQTQQAAPAQTNTPQAAPAQTNTQPTKQAEQTTKSEPAKQEPRKQPNQTNNSGLEAKYTREQCIAAACSYVGAGGQATGPALNVVASDPITGGGTVYYNVELDLGDVHYKVMVDAIDGNVVSADSTHNGITQIVGQGGEAIEGTEVETQV